MLTLQATLPGPVPMRRAFGRGGARRNEDNDREAAWTRADVWQEIRPLHEEIAELRAELRVAARHAAIVATEEAEAAEARQALRGVRGEVQELRSRVADTREVSEARQAQRCLHEEVQEIRARAEEAVEASKARSDAAEATESLRAAGVVRAARMETAKETCAAQKAHVEMLRETNAARATCTRFRDEAAREARSSKAAGLRAAAAEAHAEQELQLAHAACSKVTNEQSHAEEEARLARAACVEAVEEACCASLARSEAVGEAEAAAMARASEARAFDEAAAAEGAAAAARSVCVELRSSLARLSPPLVPAAVSSLECFRCHESHEEACAARADCDSEAEIAVAAVASAAEQRAITEAFASELGAMEVSSVMVGPQVSLATLQLPADPTFSTPIVCARCHELCAEACAAREDRDVEAETATAGIAVAEASTAALRRAEAGTAIAAVAASTPTAEARELSLLRRRVGELEAIVAAQGAPTPRPRSDHGTQDETCCSRRGGSAPAPMNGLAAPPALDSARALPPLLPVARRPPPQCEPGGMSPNSVAGHLVFSRLRRSSSILCDETMPVPAAAGGLGRRWVWRPDDAEDAPEAVRMAPIIVGPGPAPHSSSSPSPQMSCLGWKSPRTARP